MYPDQIREKIHFQGFSLADLYPYCIVQYLFRGDGVDHRYELFRYYDIYQLVYQTQKHILIKISCNSMPNISDEDYRTLEVKIHTEIQKIFSQFMKDFETKTVRPDKTVTTEKIGNLTRREN